MNIKKLVRGILKLTPYEIKRRKSSGDDEHYDALGHNTETSMNELFSSAAFLARYNSPARQRLHNRTLEWIAEKMAPEAVRLVGDFGCGPADFFALMAGRYPAATYYGYDFSEAVLRAAQHGFPGGVYEKHDIYGPPPRAHDVTICSQTLEHLLEPEMALRRLVAATNPGGLLIITVPDGRADTYRGHINFWSAESWHAWLARNLPNTTVEVRQIDKSTSGGASLGAALRIG